MTLEKWPPSPSRVPTAIPGELITEFRSRIALQESEAAERRRLEVAELVSDHHTLEERIRIWERLFGLPLPSDPEHPLVEKIAASTELTVEQVRGEQRRRWPDAKRSPYRGASWNVSLPR